MYTQDSGKSGSLTVLSQWIGCCRLYLKALPDDMWLFSRIFLKMADKSQHVVDKSHLFLLFWDLSDTIWDLYVRSWDLSDLRWDLSYTSWDLSDTSWDLSDLCVGQVPKKKINWDLSIMSWDLSLK